MLKPIFLAAMLLAGCEYNVQNSSGAEYLAATPAAAGKLDQRITRAASVEPLLRFPARIGLARIVQGKLTTIPPGEGSLWGNMAESHKAMGQFIPISPLIAEFTEHQTRWAGADRSDVVETIRLGAARQHLDAVLIYEVGARARKGSNLLAIGDLTIIGAAILPSRTIKAQGVAQALLIDVRNSYPYGTAQAQADISRLSVAFGSYERKEAARLKAIEKTVGNLIPEVEKMMLQVVQMRSR